METCEAKDFGGVLRKMRTKLGLSLRDLEARTGIFPSNLSSMEAGRVRVGLKTFDRLAEAVALDESDRLEMNMAFTAARMRHAGKRTGQISPEVALMMADILKNYGIDAGRLRNLELLEFQKLHETLPRPRVWFACEHGVKPQPDYKAKIMSAYLAEKRDRDLLLAILRRNGKVAILELEQMKLSPE